MIVWEGEVVTLDCSSSIMPFCSIYINSNLQVQLLFNNFLMLLKSIFVIDNKFCETAQMSTQHASFSFNLEATSHTNNVTSSFFFFLKSFCIFVLMSMSMSRKNQECCNFIWPMCLLRLRSFIKWVSTFFWGPTYIPSARNVEKPHAVVTSHYIKLFRKSYVGQILQNREGRWGLCDNYMFYVAVTGSLNIANCWTFSNFEFSLYLQVSDSVIATYSTSCKFCCEIALSHSKQ